MSTLDNKTKEELAALKNKKLPIIFIVGGPGSGKGTQCVKISEKYGFKHLSSGDLLRDDVKSGKPRGEKLDKMMKAGQLVPLEVVLDLIKEAIVANKNAKGFLIDGYPREVEQGQRFEAEIWECSLVIYYDASDNVMTKRLLSRALTSNRVDDNAETIEKRLVTFHSQTKPVVEYYVKQNKLSAIEGEGTVEEIFIQTSKAIDDFLIKKK